MKSILRIHFVITFFLFLTACGQSGGGSSSNAPTGVETQGDSVKHVKDECPHLAGTFVSEESSVEAKSLSTSATDAGVILDDTGVKWIIDGKPHAGDGAANLSYVGSCRGSAIGIELFQGVVRLGTMKYALKPNSRLAISLNSNDSRIGPSSAQVWHQ